jgi:diguanylate cyclase (GGDEF)-like protein
MLKGSFVFFKIFYYQGTIMSDINNTNIQGSYKRQFKKLDRSIKMVNEFSEFLKLLDLREIGMLRVMMLRFMIESVEASLGRIMEFKNDQFVVMESFSYRGGRISNRRISSQDRVIDKGKPEYKDIYKVVKKEFPVILKYVTLDWIDRKNCGSKEFTCSVIRVPIVVNDKVRYVAELIKKVSSRSAPFDEEDLSTVTIISNIASAIFTNAELFNSAIHDKLTNLYNVHYFRELVSNELVKVLKFKTNFSLALIDLDHFKSINDTYGHNVGDEALKFFSRVLSEEFRRASDVVARYGGDEFIVAFPSTNDEGAYIVCEKVRKRLSKEPLLVNGITPIFLTLSVGIAEVSQEDIEGKDNTDEIFKRLFLKADTALYNSKRTGRNRITIYSPEMPLIEEREL